VAWGFNGFPAGVADSPGRLGDHEIKNRLSVHAELNAVLNSAADVSGWTLYCTKPPCMDCAKALIQKRLSRVVSPAIRMDSRWASVQMEAALLLMEAGVEVDQWQA
jgi:dCMP deaminase